MPKLMRGLYSLAWWLAMPLVLARLWWRGRREPGYREHLEERFGFYPDDLNLPAGSAEPDASSDSTDSAAPAREISVASADGSPAPWLWVHAVSVGETRAAEPLIDALRCQWPAHRILLTHMTPTGRATGKALYAGHGRMLVQRYLPYDTGWMIGRLLQHYRPQLCMLIETEVWPNLVAQCNRRAIPVALVSARLSARSLARGRRLGGLIGAAAHGLSAAGAQTGADAQRLDQLGVSPVIVTGSLKFDVVPPAAQVERGQAWRSAFGTRRVLLCASTRDGEEAAILAALKSVSIDALLVIVPRHPQRFDAVAEMVTANGLDLLRHSAWSGAALNPAVQVLLGDSMGEMFAWYACADVAFVGGSLEPLGGQNLIEACAVGTPVLVGPHTFNFADVTGEAIAAGAALRIDDAASLLVSAQALLADEAVRGAMAGAARAFAACHRGATRRTIDMLRPMLPERRS